MQHRSWLLLLALAGCTTAGGTSTDTSPDGSTADAADATTADATAPDAITADATADVAADTSTADVAPDASADAGRLVINEISAAGDEWVELFNAGAAPMRKRFLRALKSVDAKVRR